MSALTLRGIEKRFAGLQVLSGIDLTVEDGERHAVIGPNGAGKSTLFNIISGLVPPTSGQVFYRNKDITRHSPQDLARIGIGRSFQIINIFPALTVYNNIRSAVVSRRGRRFDFWHRLNSIKEVADETRAVLATIGLLDRRDEPGTALSYGEQRRLEIALTIALQPDLLLLDEPCAGLDADDTRRVIDLIRRITEGRTLIMVEHDMNVVFGIADRVSVIYYGRVLATGTPDEIRANKQVQDAYLGRRAHVAAT